MARVKTKRLFFALWPDERVRDKLHQLQQTLDLTDSRLVHKDDLHITLQYLGQASEEQLDCVKAAALRVDAASISLEIDSIHHWRKPRVLWAGLADMPDELRSLVHQLGEQLTFCGFPPEARSYQPHVTLARKVRAADSSQLPDTISWEVNEFVLVLSHTDGRVPRYEPIARFLFAGQKKILENK